jgi:uncharacterized phage infection (PIP) family protein YhgE
VLEEVTAAGPLTLGDNRKTRFLGILAGCDADLTALARSSEAEVESVGRAFKSLAGQADTILRQAAAIVGCVEQEGMATVLTSVRSLSLTVREFLGRRVQAASAIVETLRDEEKLLLQLLVLSQSQEAISRHLRALSVLTNVEVARLGKTGGNFQLLAQELSTFSKALARQTLELARDTENHKQSISDTRKELAANLPRLRSEMAQMEGDIERTLRLIDAGQHHQASIPKQFHQGAEGTAQQIAGVVAAIQTHDITRQQIEHVQQALQLMASRIADMDRSADDFSAAYVGLNIQICQLKNIHATVTNWTSQVRRCMEGIQQLSTSEVVGIGPTVVQQEHELSSELAHIERLQQRSQEYSGRMQRTLGGLSSLGELVNAHLKRSQSIRDRLQILMFNSLIEAQRLGGRGAVVSAIASLIKEVSEEWNAIASQSRTALSEILRLVQSMSAVMEVFSEVSCQKLRADQTETGVALERVRNAAAFVAKEAAQMQAVTERMQANLAEVSDTGNSLEACFGRLNAVLGQMEGLSAELKRSDPQIAERCNAAEVERWLSALYTTEIERDVMNSALHGTPMPVVQQSFAGNAVELF